VLREYVALAIGTLRAQRLRAALTVLAIAIGVGAVIVMTSIAQSALASMARGIEEIGGARLILLWEDTPQAGARKLGNYRRGLTRADAEALGARVPHLESITTFSTRQGAGWRVRGGPERRTDMVGGDEHYLMACSMQLVAGRNLTPEDLARRERVAVVGEELAAAAFGDAEAVGGELIVRGATGDERYRIVGRLGHVSRSGVSFGVDWNDFVLVPATVERPDGRAGLGLMLSTDKAHNPRIIELASALLRHRHNGLDDFQFMDMGGVLAKFYAVFLGVLVLVGVISGTSLVIGGVGIMNIMLVVLAERRKEIGLRRAVGADRGAVTLQFLVEAVVLSLSGAVVGLVGGVGLAGVLAVGVSAVYPDWVGVVSWPAAALAVAAAAATGVFFGWHPARQAAEVDPVASLRAD
jgi:putative ABC transport system permease protein